jgi:hypothetical protein
MRYLVRRDNEAHELSLLSQQQGKVVRSKLYLNCNLITFSSINLFLAKRIRRTKRKTSTGYQFL